MILIEDEKSGYQFFNSIVKNADVISAEGNSNIYSKMLTLPESSQILVIADGAAFGAYIENIVKYSQSKTSIGLYFPESFEWLVLKSGLIGDLTVSDILAHPEDYIDSEKYVSWERFFTALLREKTSDSLYMKYEKEMLAEFYTRDKNAEKIIGIMPEEVRKLIIGK